MNDNTEWVTLDNTAFTNTTPGSNRDVTIYTTPVCPNMTNKEFRRQAMRARDIGVLLIRERMVAVARWDTQERDRAEIYFARADEEIRSTLATGLPRLLAAMQELVPEKIVRWDSEMNRGLTCSVAPDSGVNHAAVCKPDSEKRVIAIYSKFCSISLGELFHECKIKTLIHECTHYTDTFNSTDEVYADTESGAKYFAKNHPDVAIKNADNITGYIATFDGRIIK
ncbi:M35 family metallo-endopeptidase [Paraburkholderia sp. ZP32-5]|uniref:M35 family metallo-endopeptidase n=1 Tax=Paraburkholderia sp. ZP32-5 TaxID=2883245 RepID=UPI001F2648FE|nr:M35 family metallo-endopeptidase [Paraburkholderia sp. ZP32-5]